MTPTILAGRDQAAVVGAQGASVRTDVVADGGGDPQDVYTQAAALAQDPAVLQEALKALLTQRLVANYKERIALVERANDLAVVIRSDEAALNALNGTAAPPERTPGLMDKAAAVISGLQGAATTNPAVAQAFDILDKKSGGLFSQFFATATKQAE